MNSSAKNYSFSKKRLVYDQTKLAMTKTIAEKDKIEPSYIEQRQKMIVNKLIEAFNL